MDKLQLPTVTLICVDCVDAGRAIKVLERCKSLCDFAEIKLLTSIPTDYPHATRIMPLNSLIAYSIFMLTNIHRHISTNTLLVVQRDGWILNPQSFNPEWLELDFIGPLFIQYDKCGSGGFSLRSKKLMQHMADITPKWDGTQRHAEEIQKKLSFYEDGEICLHRQSNKFKIATLEQAAAFAQGGNRNPKYFREYPFGFHRTWQTIDMQTGRVDSSDLSKDLHVTYNHEIDALI